MTSSNEVDLNIFFLTSSSSGCCAHSMMVPLTKIIIITPSSLKLKLSLRKMGDKIALNIMVTDARELAMITLRNFMVSIQISSIR